MSYKSPLFKSAIELIAHATEIFSMKIERKNKFVILHLANAIELILKDKLIDEGLSIYSNNSTTISLWKSFELLEQKNIVIKHRPIIELLIDDRNTIQHRFGHPNADSTYFYLEIVINFLNTFLEDYYSLNLGDLLKEYLTEGQLNLLGFTDDEYKNIERLIDVAPDSAVIKIYELIEQKINFAFFDRIFYSNGYKGLVFNDPFVYKLIEKMNNDGLFPIPINFNDLNRFKHIRNGILNNVFGQIIVQDVLDCAEFGINILKGFDNATEEYFNNIPICKDGEDE